MGTSSLIHQVQKTWDCFRLADEVEESLSDVLFKVDHQWPPIGQILYHDTLKTRLFQTSESNLLLLVFL